MCASRHRQRALRQLFALPRLHASAQLADASMRVPKLEREATDIAARAELVGGVLKVDDVSARLGASQLRQAGVDIVFLKPMRMEHTRGQASIVLNDLLPGLRAREPFAKLLRSVPTLSGVAAANVRNVALRFGKPRQLAYDLSVTPQHVRIETDQAARGGRACTGAPCASRQRRSMRMASASRLLDSRATVSGELTDFQGGKPRVTARVADGVVGRKLVDWIWLRTALPERLKPATPLRFTAPRVAVERRGPRGRRRRECQCRAGTERRSVQARQDFHVAPGHDQGPRQRCQRLACDARLGDGSRLRRRARGTQRRIRLRSPGRRLSGEH